MFPDFAERILSPLNCGICPIVNPPLKDEPSAIIVFPGETFRLIPSQLPITTPGSLRSLFERSMKGSSVKNIDNLSG